MADNLTLQTTPATPASGTVIATYQLQTFSGDANAHVAPTVLGTLSGAEGSYALTLISSANPLPVLMLLGNPTRTTTADQATAAQLVAANTGRVNLLVYNDSTEVLFLRFGGAPTLSDYDFPVAPGQFFNMLRDLGGVYRGAVHGIWENDSTGTARVADYTAA